MAAVIDYTAIPHIVERVIDECCAETLLALRVLSRSFQDRIDRRLFNHVSLQLTGYVIQDDAVFKMTFRPRFDLRDGRSLTLPFKPEQVQVADISTRCPTPPGFWEHDDLWPDLIDAQRLSSLHTVRRFGVGCFACGYDEICVTTVVDYLDLHADSDLSGHMVNADGSRLRKSHSITHRNFFTGFGRYVLHIRLDDDSELLLGDDSLSMWFGLYGEPGNDLHDMVVVIHPPATTQARILAQLHKVCVCAGIGYARLEGYGGTLKYVGYDAFERAAAAATGTECEVRQLRKAMEWVREDVEDKGSISMDEWLSELGERRELEGEWINWRPPSSV